MKRQAGVIADPSSDTSQSPLDPEFLLAVLAVHRHLEPASQLRELARIVSEWAGAEAGFAFGAQNGQNGWSVVGSTLDDQDDRLERIARIPVVEAKRFVPEQSRMEEGFGSLAGAFRDWREGQPARSLLLAVRGPNRSCFGMVQLWFGDEGPEDAAVDRVHRFLQEVRQAVGQAQEVATMQQLIIKDDTAHCFNRRYFEEFLPEELARASRFRAPLSLIFLDMDGLKGVNTRYGHARGSRCLLEVSVRIRGRIRKFDKLFRFGGDEFCIVLPETECHGAREVAERVRDAIASRPFLAQEVGGDGVKMTASLGIAAYPLHARNKQELIQLADEAMQSIKKGDKDGVAVALGT